MTIGLQDAIPPHRLLQELTDGAGGLADAVLIFHQREAHVALAQRAEADAGRDGDQGLLHQQLGELERAAGAIALGQGRPYEHRSARLLDGPTGAIETVHQHIAALLINGADLARIVLALAQSDDGGDLDGLENAVIQVALDARQRADHAGVAEAVTHAPAGHVVTLGHGEDLDGHFFGALHLQDAGRLVAIEAEVGIGEIVNDERAVAAGHGHDLAKEIEFHAGGGGVVRKRDEDQLGWTGGGAIQVLEAIQEFRRTGYGKQAGVAFGHDHTVLMDGVCRIRRDHRIARSDHREEQVREGVLGADGDDGFCIGIEFHAIIGLVAPGDFLAQAGDAAGSRIPVVARITSGFDHFGDHHARRGAIGIAHAQIDDVLLRGARARPHFVDHGKHVRR